MTKVIGDLAGPAAFALMMGLSRTIYGVLGHRLDLTAFIASSSVLCVAMYLTAALTTAPVLGLLACALTGFSVGIMWPGPPLVGLVASANGDSLKTGLLFGSMFALVLLACVVAARKTVVGEREPLH